MEDGEASRGATRERGSRSRRSLGHWIVAAVLASGLPTVGQGAIQAQEATEIVVSNTSDDLNGDVSSAGALEADPGPDGISLREAVEVTNHDPGTYAIRFEATLGGETITISGPPESTPLMLTGGGTTMDGDTDGDGDPDITIVPDPALNDPVFIMISSSANRLRSLALEGFHDGILMQPTWHPAFPGDGEFPTHRTFSDNVVSGLVMNVSNWGISLVGVIGSDCGVPTNTIPCPSYNVWQGTIITGNRIEAVDKGINLFLNNGVEDRIDGATITENTVRMGMVEDLGDGILVGAFGNATRARISDVLIARNDVESMSSQSGVFVVAGPPLSNTIEGVRILDNRIRVGIERGAGQGITLQAGEYQSDELAPPDPDGNLVRDVVIRGNSITGSMIGAVNINTGIGAAAQRNRVSDIRIIGNTLRTDEPTFGIYVVTSSGAPVDRAGANSRVVDLVIEGNRVTVGTGPDFRDAGGGVGAAGIALVGGHGSSRDNVVRNVRIARNSVRTAYVGIRVLGGLGPTATGNRVLCVPLSRNRIIDARREVSVRSNVDGAFDNRAKLAC